MRFRRRRWVERSSKEIESFIIEIGRSPSLVLDPSRKRQRERKGGEGKRKREGEERRKKEKEGKGYMLGSRIRQGKWKFHRGSGLLAVGEMMSV